jgi:hypothetical protein
MDGASRTLAVCTALATLAAVTLRLFKQEESSANTSLKSVCKLVTETKQSVSQKEVTKPEPSGPQHQLCGLRNERPQGLEE